MAHDEERARRLGAHAEEARDACARADDAQAQALKVAARVAKTEEKVAATMDKLATRHPGRAVHLRGLSEAARKQAAHIRQWIDSHSNQQPQGHPS